MPASALRIGPDGGSKPLSERSTADRWTSERSGERTPGVWSATAPASHASPSATAVASAAPPTPSAMPSAGTSSRRRIP